MSNQHRPEKNEEVRSAVRDAYGKIAEQGGSCCGKKSSCCGSSAPEELAKEVGYSVEELSALPEGANMGLSCGNPTAVASLQEGEVVLDLGSGGGFDVFIAARKVGKTGRVIGVDMTAEMVSKARKNASTFKKQTGLDNVEFRLGEIEHLPVADASVDVVISNCVINLSPDKPQVWREVARVLKPGGRVAVSDLALLKPLPRKLEQSIAALVGCIAGAALVEETESMMRAAGLADVKLLSKPQVIDSMAQWSDPVYRSIIEKLPRGQSISEYVTSLYAVARKPGWTPHTAASSKGKPRIKGKKK